MCLLLSIYVIMLSVKPCCADNDCQNQKEFAGKTPVKEKECTGCSPFFTCGTCIGFIVSKPFLISLPVSTESALQYYTQYSQPFIQKVILSIWLPPKIS
jgi:hypothetical protein